MPTQQDEANLWALLLGGIPVDNGRDAKIDDVPRYSPGVLRRLLACFPGDPIAPGQTFNGAAGVQTLTVPGRANSAVVSVDTQAIRCTFDGTTPTATVGLIVAANTIIQLTGRATLEGFQYLQAAAGAVVNVQYFT